MDSQSRLYTIHIWGLAHRLIMNEYEFILADTIAKTQSVLQQYEGKEVRVAYSGGADSDTTLWLLRESGFSVKAVLYDTGIEWGATLRHVEYMRELGFDIDIIRAKRPVPTSNKQYGHPFISKRISDYLERLQAHGFDFQGDGNKPFEELWVKYPKCKAALRWWCNDWGEGSRFNIAYNRHLKEFLTEYGLPFKVSAKCCDGAKKMPIKEYAKELGIDLMVLGIRKSEGGARASAYKSCYAPQKLYSYAMYFPLFWWKNDMKEWYDSTRNIVHSDCYVKYGMKRTGCAGCPLGQNLWHELEVLEEHEPKLSKGILNIFNPTYEWTRKFKEYKKGLLNELD